MKVQGQLIAVFALLAGLALTPAAAAKGPIEAEVCGENDCVVLDDELGTGNSGDWLLDPEYTSLDSIVASPPPQPYFEVDLGVGWHGRRFFAPSSGLLWIVSNWVRPDDEAVASLRRAVEGRAVFRARHRRGARRRPPSGRSRRLRGDLRRPAGGGLPAPGKRPVQDSPDLDTADRVDAVGGTHPRGPGIGPRLPRRRVASPSGVDCRHDSCGRPPRRDCRLGGIRPNCVSLAWARTRPRRRGPAARGGPRAPVAGARRGPSRCAASKLPSWPRPSRRPARSVPNARRGGSSCS
jgi:hypothetical protein